MEFYDVGRPQYLETNAYGISLGARLLQVRGGMNCGHDDISCNHIMQYCECLPLL